MGDWDVLTKFFRRAADPGAVFIRKTGCYLPNAQQNESFRCTAENQR